MITTLNDSILPLQIDVEALKRYREPIMGSSAICNSMQLLAEIIKACQQQNAWRTFSRREITSLPAGATAVYLVMLSDPDVGFLNDLETLRPRYAISQECVHWCYELFPKY